MTPQVRRLIGKMMVAAGALLAGLCGACTGFFEVMFLSDWWSAGSDRAPNPYIFPLYTPLVFGTLPILIGVALVVFGRRLLRTVPRA